MSEVNYSVDGEPDMVIMPLADVIQPEIRGFVRESGLLVLTEENKVTCAVIALSSDPVSQRETLAKLQELVKNQNNLEDKYELNPQRPKNLPAIRADDDKAGQNRPAQLWDQKVREVINKQSNVVQKLLDELLDELMADQAQIKSTGTAGGDLRFFFTRVNFAEIRFQTSSLLLRLRVGKDAVRNELFKYCNGVDGSIDIGTVRLTVGQPPPEQLSKWIRMAKNFTRSRN